MLAAPQYFSCPICAGQLERNAVGLCCSACSHQFETHDDIDELYAPTDWGERARYTSFDDVSSEVRAFYEDKPFPNYDEFDDIGSLQAKARRGVFARLLDEQIPLNSTIIEFGSGTAQLSLFLSARGRPVIAADMCLNSLRLGREFADSNGLDSVHFAQMNLLQPAAAPENFDLVICNGVLHHTCDTRAALESISRMVRPGGYILFGLYHFWGRLVTDLRRQLFRVSPNRFSFLDPNLRNSALSAAKKEAWFNDQYRHPHESKHTIRECVEWLGATDFEFVRSIPDTHIGTRFSTNEALFQSRPPASAPEALLKEMSMVFQGSLEGGFFTIIARKSG